MEFNFDTTSKDDKLIEPLLDLDDTEVSYESDDDESIACTCTILVGADDDESAEDDEGATTVTCRDTTILLLLFPLLLMAQFGLVFTNPLLDASLEASWSTVNFTIVMFAVTSWLYRHTLADFQISNLFALVVPEILLNVILALVLWGSASEGFMGLLVSLFALGSFVAVANLRILLSHDEENKEQVVVDDEIAASSYQAVAY